MSSTSSSSCSATPARVSVDVPSAQSPPAAQSHAFPEPAGDIDIEEALRRKPPRWTFQGQVEAHKARPVGHAIHEHSTKEDSRKKNLQQAKRDLLEMQGGLDRDAKVRNKSTTHSGI